MEIVWIRLEILFFSKSDDEVLNSLQKELSIDTKQPQISILSKNLP